MLRAPPRWQRPVSEGGRLSSRPVGPGQLIYFWEVGTDTTNYFLPFCRLAPVQCTGWGWPETSAAPAVFENRAAVGQLEAFFAETLAAGSPAGVG